MSIYKSKLNEVKIKNMLQEKYEIAVNKIEKIEKGTANIYIIFAEDEQKYILKEFDERVKKNIGDLELNYVVETKIDGLSSIHKNKIK